MNTAHQNLRFDGFGNVVVCARVQSGHLNGIFVPCGEEYNEGVPGFGQLAQRLARFHSVHFRHHEVQHHHVGAKFLGQLQGLAAVGSRLKLKPFLFEVVGDKVQNGRFVVYQKDACGLGHNGRTE